MVFDIPDYTQYVVPPPESYYPPAAPNIMIYVSPVRVPHALMSGTTIKEKHTLVTDYLKQACIIQPTIVVASPTGAIVPYEGGYAAKALIFKNGAGERALAKSVLDRFVLLQNADGSWYDTYYPVQNASGLHDKMRDLKVDSGASLQAWAMSDYDVALASTVYQSTVRKALGWLRDLQLAFITYNPGVNLLCNLIWQGSYDYTALTADCAESLLAMKRALDAYGSGLTTDPQGYSVKTMANDLYEAIALWTWTGDAGRYYQTGYPLGQMPTFPFTYKEGLSFTQALTAMAIYEWANSAYNTKPDYRDQCEKALDRSMALCAGRWGGYFYSPWYAAEDETQNEFTVYTGLMTLAMSTVNATKYAEQIKLGQAFIKWLAMTDGRVYDYVRPDGQLTISEIAFPEFRKDEGYSFLALNSAIGLLAGA